MSFCNRPGQSLFRRWHGDQMHVVQHQAIRPNLCLPPGTPSRHQVQVCFVVLFAKKCLCRRLPRCVTWWGTPGATTRAILAMPLSYYITSRVLKDNNLVWCPLNSLNSTEFDRLVALSDNLANRVFAPTNTLVLVVRTISIILNLFYC